jgi:hypothetical protein
MSALGRKLPFETIVANVPEAVGRLMILMPAFCSITVSTQHLLHV